MANIETIIDADDVTWPRPGKALSEVTAGFVALPDGQAMLVKPTDGESVEYLRNRLNATLWSYCRRHNTPYRQQTTITGGRVAIRKVAREPRK